MNRSRKQSLLIIKLFLIGRKSFFLLEWFSRGIICIKELHNENGQLLSFQEFLSKYEFRTNFLNFYQVFNAIPRELVTKACNQDKPLKENYLGIHNTKIQLAENIAIDLQKTKGFLPVTK